MPTFEEIYQQNYQKMLSYAFKYNRIHDCDVEQVVADVFLDLYKTMQTSIKIKHFFTYLCKAVQIGFALELRRRSHQKRNKIKMQRLPLAKIAIRHHDFDAIDTQDMLASVFSQLTEAEHDALKLVYDKQLDNISAAEQMGTTQGAFQRKISRIRCKCRKLRDTLTQPERSLVCSNQSKSTL